MLQRVFLGWDEPFLKKAVSWLLEHEEELPGTLLLTPTSQSGRRLREALAESAGALFSPRMATPGSLMKTEQWDIAPDWMERLAWVEVLENLRDWSTYEALFPQKPEDYQEWAGGLAQELAGLRHTLQENGLLLTSAAKRLQETVEGARWQALARLEHLVEQKLAAWGRQSRSRILEEGITLPKGITHIILAGVAELPPLISRTFRQWGGKLTILIGAPSEESEHFNDLGQPEDNWAGRSMPWPEVIVASDPRQQATEAVRIAVQKGITSDQLALGSADSETGDELARAFTRHGWTAFHPAAHVPQSSLIRWLKIWCKWLQDPSCAILQDLLTLPETSSLIKQRAQKTKQLAKLRDQRMIIRTQDLERRLAEEKFPREQDRWMLEDAQLFEKWRKLCLGTDFISHLVALIGKLSQSLEAEEMIHWLKSVEETAYRMRRPARFWIELMISDLPSPAPLPPAGRVIDIQGWLEIFHESGEHLILCGMNEGKVPARSGGEPWLSETSRELLGLTRDKDRAARDAYLYSSMLHSHRKTGSVHVICGKTGAGGEALLPSRLLLAATKKELPIRVKALFREIEPPEAGLRWEADWLWQPPLEESRKRLSVTSLSDYLACPFRYYLKHVLQMRQTEPNRNEWNARDFGTVTHEVLERWALDTEAREWEKAEALHAWLSAELDQVVAAWFGKRPPLAIRIQTEALRQRLYWFARIQGCEKASGWSVKEVERKVEIPMDDVLLVAKIDRIDYNERTGEYRVLDYKTGKVAGVDRAHRKRFTSKTILPAHLSEDSPAIYEGEEKGKAAKFRWSNLQLPLYAAAWLSEKESLPTPCYWTLGNTEAGVAIQSWQDFSHLDMEAALECARWISQQIQNGIFGPPAERVTYDDYRILSAGRDLKDMVTDSFNL